MADEKTDKQKKHDAKRAAIKKAAYKSATHAHYVVGPQMAYSEGRLYQPGEIIRLPLDKEPSHTFRPASKQGVAMAEAAEVAESAEVGDESAAPIDEGTAETEVDEVEGDGPAPTPPARPAKAGKGVAKPAPKKAGKGSRASDRDVA